jgi:hypothetical protein
MGDVSHSAAAIYSVPNRRLSSGWDLASSFPMVAFSIFRKFPRGGPASSPRAVEGRPYDLGGCYL